jgi:hypothetical protein
LVARRVVGGLQVGNTTGSFLTTDGGAMNEKESSSSSIQVFVVIVEVAGNDNEGRCRLEREETIDDRRERAGIAVK